MLCKWYVNRLWKWKCYSLSPVWLFATPTRLLCPCDSPGNKTGVGCHFLLQGIFPTQGLNPGLLHCHLRFFTICATREGSPGKQKIQVLFFGTFWNCFSQIFLVCGWFCSCRTHRVPIIPTPLPSLGLCIHVSFLVRTSPGHLDLSLPPNTSFISLPPSIFL